MDALLAAVDTGQVQPDSAAQQVYGTKSKAQVEVQTYDFKRPERVSKDQMRALEGLHEGFGRNFGAAINNLSCQWRTHSARGGLSPPAAS